MRKLVHIAWLVLAAALGACGSGAGQETVVIGPAGGEHTFKNGITLRVPAGALDVDTKLWVRPLEPGEIGFFTEARALAPADVLFAVAGTDGVTFNEDVTLVIPVAAVPPGAVPVMYYLDLAAEAFSQNLPVPGAAYALKLDPAGQSVELALRHFSGHAASLEKYYKEKGEEYCAKPENACRCGPIEVEQSDSDYSCTDRAGNCQVVSSSSAIEFTDCGITAEWKMEEVTDGCQPVLSLVPGAVVIEPGAQTSLKAQVKIGCGPRQDQNVSFTVTGPGTMPIEGNTTGPAGSFETTVTSTGAEGKITVGGVSDVQWYRAYEKVSDSAIGEEVIANEQRTAHLTRQVDIYVSATPRLSLEIAKTSLRPGEPTPVSATVTRSGQALGDVEVRFTVEGPATVSPASATTSAYAPAAATLTAGDAEGTATLRAVADVHLTIDGDEVTVPITAERVVTITEEEQSATLAVSATPAEISGLETAAIAATFRDGTGNPIPGAQISFFAYTADGESAAFSRFRPADGTTGSDGTLTAVFDPRDYSGALTIQAIARMNQLPFSSGQAEAAIQVNEVVQTWSGTASIEFSPADCYQMVSSASISFTFGFEFHSTSPHARAIQATATQQVNFCQSETYTMTENDTPGSPPMNDVRISISRPVESGAVWPISFFFSSDQTNTGEYIYHYVFTNVNDPIFEIEKKGTGVFIPSSGNSPPIYLVEGAQSTDDSYMGMPSDNDCTVTLTQQGGQ